MEDWPDGFSEGVTMNWYGRGLRRKEPACTNDLETMAASGGP